MGAPQITGHVRASEREQFERHARRFGLDVAALLTLLLVRQLRIGDVSRLDKAAEEVPDLFSTVTAHVRDPQFKTDVQALAAGASVSVSRLCAVLVRSELREHWIERAISLPTQFESA